jgi:hypothetical protein
MNVDVCAQTQKDTLFVTSVSKEGCHVSFSPQLTLAHHHLLFAVGVQAISTGELPPLLQHQQSNGTEWCEFAPLSSNLRQQRQQQGWYMRPIVWFRWVSFRYCWSSFWVVQVSIGLILAPALRALQNSLCLHYITERLGHACRFTPQQAHDSCVCCYPAGSPLPSRPPCQQSTPTKLARQQRKQQQRQGQATT